MRQLNLSTVVATLTMVIAQPLAARPRTVENAELKYSVAVPSECRTQEGPGTLEAICAPDMDEAKSVDIPAAISLFLEVDAEPVPADAKAYTETEFRQDVPEAVCGETDNPKTKFEGIKQSQVGGASIFTATITCPEIKFLGLPERVADVRYVMSQTFRYRLMARSLVSDAEATKAAKQAYLSSFKPAAEKKP